MLIGVGGARIVYEDINLAIFYDFFLHKEGQSLCPLNRTSIQLTTEELNKNQRTWKHKYLLNSDISHMIRD